MSHLTPDLLKANQRLLDLRADYQIRRFRTPADIMRQADVEPMTLMPGVEYQAFLLLVPANVLQPSLVAFMGGVGITRKRQAQHAPGLSFYVLQG